MANGMMEMRVRVEGGYLVATPSYDDDYPGIDVEFRPDKEVSDGTLSFPRILMEKPVGEGLRAFVWNDSSTEDYTKKINFE